MISSLITSKRGGAEQQSVLRKLLENLRADEPQTLGVAACSDDGGARIARELAHTAARLENMRVLIVQLRPSTTAIVSDNSSTPPRGWRDFVAGRADLADVLRLDAASGISIMAAGTHTGLKPSPQTLRAALETLHRQFDLVVFHLAALAGRTERELAAELNGVVIVLEPGRTSRELAHRAKRNLNRAGAKVLGVVFDGRPPQRSHRSTTGNTRRQVSVRRRRRWYSFFGRPRASTAQLAGEIEFRAAVELERMRADRTNIPFSLLIYNSASGDLVGRTLTRYCRVVLGRIRATDTAGWLDGHRAAVLLPDTSADGAKHLSSELTRLLETAGIAAQWRVQTYQPRRSDGSPPDGRAAQTGGDTSTSANGDRQPVESAPSINLEAMFAQPLPRWKRWLDIAAALVGLLLCAPLLAACATGIRLTSKGPAVFTQMRSGLGGRPFRMYKFRSMYLDAERRQAALRPLSEQDGPAFKLKHDPRITWFGRILRQSSIDELPQLWNVLRGEMTLVGPRPLPMEETEGCQSWHRRRLLVTPGLTCIWQVNGRSQVPFDEWMRMDLRYVRRHTLLGDLKLILQTIPAVLLRRGAQ